MINYGIRIGENRYQLAGVDPNDVNAEVIDNKWLRISWPDNEALLPFIGKTIDPEKLEVSLRHGILKIVAHESEKMVKKIKISH